jgi:hypothetical protein
LVLLLGFLSLPVLQRQFTLINEKPLQGSYHAVSAHLRDSLTLFAWFNGGLQREADLEADGSVGFRNSLIRIHNQIDYSFFRKVNAEGVVCGKKNELFEEDYIKAFQGEYFIGEKVWKDKAKKLKAIQDTLKKLNKEIVVIFEPGKGTVYKDRFPENYSDRPRTVSNSDVFIAELKSNNVNILDLNEYFVHLRDNDPNRIFPRGGTHWSYYGAAKAADTSLRYLNMLTNDKIPLFTISKVVKFQKPRHPDADIWLAMNVIQSAPNDNLVYPVIQFDTEIKPGLDVLVIGDSFYFNWLSDSIMFKAFKNCDFWYYNKHNWSRDGVEVALVSDLNWQQEVMKRDLIIIMITERFHHNFAWNFDEQLYNHFYPDEENLLEAFSNNLRISNDQFMRLVSDAKVKKISLEDRIAMESSFLLYEDHLKNPTKYSSRSDLVTIIMMSIRSTPDWLAKVEAKAKANNISVDEMIRKDAEWIYNEKYGNQ